MQCGESYLLIVYQLFNIEIYNEMLRDFCTTIYHLKCGFVLVHCMCII
jgi:hypothetical protein